MRQTWLRALGWRWKSRITRLRPWLFTALVLCVTALMYQPGDQTARDADEIVRVAGHRNAVTRVELLRVIDGDTFTARVHIAPDRALTTRIRLRTIDAPELKGACTAEIRLAESARDELQRLLREGGLTARRIDADKYPGRINADIATTNTADVSAALVKAGLARSYSGGARQTWCAITN